MIWDFLLFVVGIIFLVKGADFLVDGSSSLAKRLGIPTLIVGLTIVAFGTSLPELFVNIFAATTKNSEIALGNIIGSNITNILLILGLSAVITPLRVQHSTIWREIPFSFIAAILLFIFCSSFLLNTAHIGVLESLILLCFFAAFLYYIAGMIKNRRSKILEKEIGIHKHSKTIIVIMIICGIVGLYLGGKWVVNGAIEIATRLGVSQYLISASIIAVGTSLPELVTSLIAAKKKEMDIAVGNVVGSNIFNILFVLGITGLISPILISKRIAADIIFLLIITTLLFIFMFIGKKHELERWQGATFVILYVGYIIMLILKG